MIPHSPSYGTINKTRIQVHLFRRYKLGNILTFWEPLNIGSRITLILRNLKNVSFRLRHMENQSVQSLSHIWLFTAPWTEACQGFPVHHQLPEFTQTHVHVHWVGYAIQPSHPLSSPSPPAFNLSQQQGLFQWVSFSHQVAKVLEFQPQHQSFQWIFRTDFLYNWLVWSPCIPTLKSLFQHHSSKASILQRSAFFMVQLSYPYMISGKTIALSRRSFVGKVMSLLFNMLSSFVIVFLPRSKRLLISCMQLPFAVILEPKKVKSVTSHLCTMKWWDQMPLSSFFECWVLSQILRSPLTFIKRLFSFSLLSAIRVVSSVYLTLLIFLLVILIPAFASFSLAFHMTYSAYTTLQK